jgi:hypothetical protein
MEVCEMSDTKARDANPEACCIGIEAVAAYISNCWGFDLDAAGLKADIEREGLAHEMWNGTPVFHKRTIDVWVIGEYGAHDGTEIGMQVMYDNFVHGNQPGYGHYEPYYISEDGKVGLVWVDETPPTPEEIARWAAEREAGDPKIDDDTTNQSKEKRHV